MSSIEVMVTLPDAILQEAQSVGLLEPETLSEIVQDALVSGHYTNRRNHKEDWSKMTPDERRANIDARFDKFPVDTVGWKFNRDEIYGELNERHDIS